MKKWPNNEWINENYLDNLQKYQIIESLKRDPDKIFKIMVENRKLVEEITVLKRQLAEKSRPWMGGRITTENEIWLDNYITFFIKMQLFFIFLLN